MTKPATTGFLQNLLLLLVLTASLIPIRDATSEGDALFTMMTKWKVHFPGWVQGGDPCAERWVHVECRDGQVVTLNVTSSGITGSLPSEIGNLRFLEVLDISNLYNAPGGTPNNSLSGVFPDNLAQCTLLKSFNASNIIWDIEFPSVLTKLTALEELYMSAALIRGTIPDDFYNLRKLRYLFLGNNKLGGSLVKLANLQNLVQLAVSENNFKGTMPNELGNLTKLEYFNCHTCNLTGPLPNGLSKAKSLQNITIHRNELTGPMPDSWKNLTSMRQLRVDLNYLSGPFPSWMFTEWPNLNWVQLSKNSFSGPVPHITDLDAKHNVTNTYYRLRWDCNYLNGSEPCSSPSCSNQTVSRTEGSNAPFNFERNCYSNIGQKDLTDVYGDCDVYHPNDVTCDDFYQTLNAGGCPRCPTNQVLFPPGGTCVCESAGLIGSGGGGVPVGGVVGGVLGVSAVFLLIIAAILYKRRKQFSFLDIFTVKGPKEDGYWEAPPGVERFSLHDLAKVTHNFNDTNMIGQGGFGKVFVGTLDDGRMVAIKRATAGGLQGTSEFRNEVSLLSRLHHRHLVRLEGFCDEEDFQILVYEFMKKGNLHAHLLGKLTTTPLHWYKRLEIAYGVAQGLEYLHSFADPPVIHRDVKPSNILLDDNMVAKLADFGISKVSPEYDTHVSTRPAGTAGYLDPDYFMRRQLTTASDVYGYGVVLLELVTGQEAIDHTRLEEFNLIEWVNKRFKTRGVVSIVDHLIEDDYSPEAFAEMAKLGLQCCSFNRDERPSMKVVLSTLEPLMAIGAPSLGAGGEPRKEGKKGGKKGMRVAFETEYPPERKLLDSTDRSSSSDHTSRSNTSDVGTNAGLMYGSLGPR